MSISKLKDDARKHELREEWEKAVQVYLQILIQSEREGDVELPLYNRIGDIYIRLNQPTEAVRYYEQAADRYAEADLYNNAIALCNKALRYDAQHTVLLRKLGLFSAMQGFHTDARRYFVDFADKQVAQGRGDDALRALEEYARVSETAESQELYGRRLLEHGRSREGLAQMRAAYEKRVAAGEADQAEALRADLELIDPEAVAAAESKAPLAESTAPPTETIEDIPVQPEAEPVESVVETGTVGELEIERGAFEPPDEGYDTIEVDRIGAETAAEPPAYAAVEGLESAMMDFVADDDLEEQDLGTDFEREAISFEAPPRDDVRAELPVLGEDDELPLLGDGPSEEEASPPTAFEVSTPSPLDAPLLDLSTLAHGGIFLPEFENLAGSTSPKQVESDFSTIDIPLLADDELPGEEPMYDDHGLVTGRGHGTFEPPSSTGAGVALEQPSETTFDEEVAQSGVSDIAAELDQETLATIDDETALVDGRSSDFDAAFEQPPPFISSDAVTRAPFDRPLAGWPEDPDDDIAAATFAEEDETQDDVSARLAAEADTLDDVGSSLAAEADTFGGELEDATAWEEQADAALEEMSADAVPVDDDVTSTELETPSEFDEPLAVEDPFDAEPLAEAAPPRFLVDSSLDDEWETESVAASDESEYEAYEDPREEVASEDIAVTETMAVEPAPAEAVEIEASSAQPLVPPATTSSMAARITAPTTDPSYVDLNALLVDDEEATTRFQIQETSPSGDEDQDFAELLGRFKEKVAQHVPPEDAAAHYDLGLAFKEMGLIDEAIAEFQVALRTGPMRLKVYEELGQCFLLKEQYNIAEKVLRQALQVEFQHELDLLGIYYQLGRAYEAMGKREQARDAYERVLGMDLTFQDTSERLARL